MATSSDVASRPSIDMMKFKDLRKWMYLDEEKGFKGNELLDSMHFFSPNDSYIAKLKFVVRIYLKADGFDGFLEEDVGKFVFVM